MSHVHKKTTACLFNDVMQALGVIFDGKEVKVKMSKSLEQFNDENSKFLILQDGVPTKVKFISYEVVPSTYDSSKETVIYTVEHQGKTRLFRTSSIQVSQAFAKIQKGEVVEITKRGEGRSVKYSVKKTD